MGYKIAICDDVENERKLLSTAVEQWSEQTNNKVNTETFPSAESFLFDYEEHKDYDILLLDVEMTGLSGIDLAKQIRKENKRVEIVFITSHFEFAGEGYEVDALHYLVKPIRREKLFEVLTKAVEVLKREPSYVVIECEGETIKLVQDEILYVESQLHYINICTKKKEYKMKRNLSSFEQELEEYFYRVHRSYLVNLKSVVRISRTSVMLSGNLEVPLARGKYDEINEAYIKYL